MTQVYVREVLKIFRRVSHELLCILTQLDACNVSLQYVMYILSKTVC